VKKDFCAYILLCELMFLLPGYIKRELYSVVRRGLVIFFGIYQVTVREGIDSVFFISLLKSCLFDYRIISGNYVFFCCYTKKTAGNIIL